MLSYSYKRVARLKLRTFYNVVLNVKDYKGFLPWCKDSWETEHRQHAINTEEDFELKYFKKYNLLNFLQSQSNESGSIDRYDGGIKVGFDFLDFSYVSEVRAVEPNTIVSTVIDKGAASTVFSHLESVWKLNQHDKESIHIDYTIEFKFNSILYSQFTSIFLSFLGENIVKSFIAQCEKIEKDESALEATNNNTNTNTSNQKSSSQLYSGTKLKQEIYNSFTEASNDRINDLLDVFSNMLRHIDEQQMQILLFRVSQSHQIQHQFLNFLDILDWKDKYQVSKFLKSL